MRPAYLILGLAAIPGSVAAQFRDKMAMRYVGWVQYSDYVASAASFARLNIVAVISEATAGSITLGIVAVTDLAAPTVTCEVSDQSQDGTKATNGPGLFELRFADHDSSTYRFSLACPDASRPSQPARWSGAIQSYDQPGGIGIKPGTRTPFWPETLSGTWSVPSAETDPINGVTGSTSMTWWLCQLHYVNGQSVGCTVKPPKPPTPPPPPPP